MWRIEITGDPAACRALWEEAFPRRLAVDLWETRACFHEHFRRPLRFVGARDELGLRGLLPLSWIEEAGAYGCFPGETWMGRTWLEQNRILARDPGVLEALLAACPGPYHLRYLLPDGIAGLPEASIDETGYLFHPEPFGFEMENYYAAFSHRTAKRLRREVAALSARLTLRRDDPADFDALVALNLSRFGERSYFADERFTRGFRDLLTLAQERGWLRMTALLDRDEPVAVDLGCVYQGVYTLLAGGTHGDYPGIAKVINLHHLERACA
ncbi:MAG: GNAT family N-acetyltransferase, partial [Candidatus Eisenbacteria bacterium]|nr:GNAT family N-acetyltransferase [Candidatus Eisenbacteria bacterium]